MSTKAGALLWRRARITVSNLAPLDFDTLLRQQNRAFEAGDPPDDGTVLPSRVMVLPQAPTAAWADIVHGEPFLDPLTGTIHVLFANVGVAPVEINVLFWDPWSGVGPGQADFYTAAEGA